MNRVPGELSRKRFFEVGRVVGEIVNLENTPDAPRCVRHVSSDAALVELVTCGPQPRLPVASRGLLRRCYSLQRPRQTGLLEQ